MKTTPFILILLLVAGQKVAGQSGGIDIKPGKFRAADKTILKGEVGYLTVPENRLNPNSRSIRVKFVHLKSLSDNLHEPVFYLEGGGAASTWQAESPKDLADWLPILQVSDLIFVDQRGTTDDALAYRWTGQYPEDFLVSPQAAGLHYQKLCQEALANLKNKGIDISGYTIVEHAHDIHDIAAALQIERYSLFGFSYGTHIGMATIKLFPDEVVNAVFAGADGLDQSFNYPKHLDDHFRKIVKMVAADPVVSETIKNLDGLLKKVMVKLDSSPVTVTIKHPITGKAMQVKIGPFGLALILRLDIDDTNDIPTIPRLLYTIDQGDYTMLKLFVQKRIVFAFALPGNGINQAIASGVSDERLSIIEAQSKESLFGNVVNFPFYDARKAWPANAVPMETNKPLSTAVRTLFITGSLDCRTPVQQVNEIMQGFSNATHLVVENAGHEQAMWDTEIFDEAIPQFLAGHEVSNVKAFYKEIKFVP
jgi:pimeloyl-ACP methyl ester carboxylesterase